MRLYEITTSLAQLWDEASHVIDADNTDAAEQAAALAYLEEQLKAVEGTHHEKCLNIACLIKNLEAEATAIKAEELKLADRRKSAERRSEWLRTYLAGNMEPGTNLKDARAIIGWRKSTAVEVTCKPEELPASLRRTKLIVEADKDAIKATLQAGQTVEGCKLAARFNIQIK